MNINCFKQYTGILKGYSLYWNSYGGFSSLFFSPYLALSLIISFCCWPIWVKGNNLVWYNHALSILPNMLGFTLGGYAILLTLGNERFKEIISSKDPSEPENIPSPFMGINATFLHFIFMQIVALVCALVSMVWEIKSGFFAWFGFLIFIYALVTSAAAAMAIFRFAQILDCYYSKNVSDRNK